MQKEPKPPVHVRDAQQDPRIVRAAMPLPGVVVELCDFPEILGENLILTETDSTLLLGLSPLFSHSEGRFARAARSGFKRFGALSFRPAGIASEFRFDGGAFRGIRCRFNTAALPPMLTAAALNEAQLLACFDIQSQAVEEAMLRLAEELSDPRDDSALLAEALVRVIVLDLARYFTTIDRLGNRRNGGLAPHHLRKCLVLMDNEGPPPSIDALAELCGLSRFHFMRAFKAAMGISPGAYAQAARMARAKAILRVDDSPLEAIAAQVGFGSAAAFSNAFRRAVGRSPAAYRLTIKS